MLDPIEWDELKERSREAKRKRRLWYRPAPTAAATPLNIGASKTDGEAEPFPPHARL